MNKKTVSPQTQQEALKLAKATQKPGQTKDQTKLIAQGIEHGIALYKKQQKEKQRQADKERKKQQKEKISKSSSLPEQNHLPTPEPQTSPKLPWVLLLISWIGFIAFIYVK
ncbi:DUF2956 domain-containing protein [Vibrio sp. RC27]